MTREESKQLAVLQEKVNAFLVREAERGQKLDEMYDALKVLRVIAKIGKWTTLVGGGLVIAIKTGDWSDFMRAFK